MTPTFAELVASRQHWIEESLKPWCRAASWKDLIQAHQDWLNLAGQVDPEATLWTWAWSRFPVLVSEELPGIEESYAVRVTTRDGRSIAGYPDSRKSRQGKLHVLTETPKGSGHYELAEPISIDDIERVERL